MKPTPDYPHLVFSLSKAQGLDAHRLYHKAAVQPHGDKTIIKLPKSGKDPWYYSRRFLELTAGNFESVLRSHLFGCALDNALREAQEFFGTSETPNPEPEPQPQTKTNMDYSSKPVATTTFVYGEDVNDLNESRCLAVLKSLQGDIKALQEIGVESATITKRISEKEAAIAEIVKRLDTFAA